MSQRITTGYAKSNVLYYIDKLKDYKYNFWTGSQAFADDIVWGNPKLLLNEDNSFISLNDPDFDYREVVASLPNSSLWGNTTIFDNKGDNVTIIPMNNKERGIYDRPRVFGIKEKMMDQLMFRSYCQLMLLQVIILSFIPMSKMHWEICIFKPL